jgi:GNAT superfamily N-acetyltransferase
VSEPSLTIQPFDKASHDRGAFSSGVEPMDRWLRESAAEQIKLNRLRVWCATSEEGAFVGYYALAMHSVLPVEALARKRERHALPAIYLTALAVSEGHQGQGIGSALLGDAIARSATLSKEIGTAAIILDVLKDAHYERRRSFYLSLGFAEIGSGDAARLFLSIKDALAELSAALR